MDGADLRLKIDPLLKVSSQKRTSRADGGNLRPVRGEHFQIALYKLSLDFLQQSSSMEVEDVHGDHFHRGFNKVINERETI